jgi:hypothetical protein
MARYVQPSNRKDGIRSANLIYAQQ